MENHQYSLAKPAQICQIAESGKTTLSLIKKRQTILFVAFSYLISEAVRILACAILIFIFSFFASITLCDVEVTLKTYYF